MLIKSNCLACGKEIATYQSRVKLGRGKHCSKACANHSYKGKSFSEKTQFVKGQKALNFKGWRLHYARKGGNAYREIFMPSHPRATKSGYIREHRLVMEQKIGRVLEKNEVVHHKNHNTLDNRIENLELMTVSEHCRLHVSENIHKRWA